MADVVGELQPGEEVPGGAFVEERAGWGHHRRGWCIMKSAKDGADMFEKKVGKEVCVGCVDIGLIGGSPLYSVPCLVSPYV